MKRIRIILMAVLAAVSLTASAQEPFTTLHFLYSPTRLTYSTNEDTEKFNAVAFGATYAQPIESSSFYVEFGGLVEWYFNTQAKGFVNGDNKYFDGKTNIVSVKIPLNALYSIDVSDNFRIQPYGGVYMRYNVWGEARYTLEQNVTTFKLFDKVDMGDGAYKRFQMGATGGCRLCFCDFISLSAAYYYDLTKVKENGRFQGVDLTLGFVF